MSIPYLPSRALIPAYVKNDYVVAALIAVSITIAYAVWGIKYMGYKLVKEEK